MPSKWKQFLHGLYQSNLYYNLLNRPDTASKIHKRER